MAGAGVVVPLAATERLGVPGTGVAARSMGVQVCTTFSGASRVWDLQQRMGLARCVQGTSGTIGLEVDLHGLRHQVQHHTSPLALYATQRYSLIS
jgi:hypothetical protein